MPLFAESPSATILNNYADVIEGGNSYRGSGTYWPGIPGVRSHHRLLHEGTITPLTATGAGTTTTIVSTGVSSANTDHVVRAKAAPLFAYCTQSVASGPTNVGAARKITGWAGTTCTVGSAFPSATASTDIFTIREGFYRLPDTFDIEDPDNNQDGGFDRVFQLSMMPGKRLEWYGKGIRTYESQLELKLRIEKRAASRSAIASALDNSLLFREVLTSGTYRDTMTQAIIAEGSEPEVKVDDKNKIVIVDRYRVIYRISTVFY